MIFKVHTLKSTIRYVEVPDDITTITDVQKALDIIYNCGQNKYQQLGMPSVKVGDVAEYNGKYYMFLSLAGAQEITKEELDMLKKIWS